MDDVTEALARLHTQLVDAQSGYAEALRLDPPPETATIFRDLHDLHQRHAAALAEALRGRGATPDDDGSFMALVHKAVLNVRAVLTGLDADVLPGILDGEERILDSYEDALKASEGDAAAETQLRGQSAEIDARLAGLEAKVES